MVTGRRSKQRDLIYDVLKNTTSHPDAEWIYGEVKKVLPSISLGTVYRNLSKMVSDKEIIIIETGGDSLHYDARVEDHCHIVCRSCGRIDDLFFDNFPSLGRIAEENYTGKVYGYNLMFFGKCSCCLNNE